MAIYDTEEEQVEALKRWWKDNSQAVIIGVVVGVGLIFGIDFWKAQQHDKRLQASSVYEQLMQADSQNKADQLEKLGQDLGTQYDATAYANYAALYQVKTKVQQGDLPAAKAILEKVIAKGDSTLKNVAKLRLLSLLLASGEYEQGLKLIAETDAASIQGFSSNYEELKGDLYVALGRTDEARTAYENALREGAESALLQFKLDDLTALPLKAPSITEATATPVNAPAPAQSVEKNKP